MTREEVLQKLSEVKIIITEFILTYDMGLQFNYLTSEGEGSNIGNVLSWPCGTYKVSEEFRMLANRIKSGEDISDDELMQNDLCKNLCTYSDPINGDWVLSGGGLTEAFDMIKHEILQKSFDEEYIYTYAFIEEWDKDIKIFNKEEELTDYFLENWGVADIPYKDMDDEDLNRCLSLVDKFGTCNLPGCGIRSDE